MHISELHIDACFFVVFAIVDKVIFIKNCTYAHTWFTCILPYRISLVLERTRRNISLMTDDELDLSSSNVNSNKENLAQSRVVSLAQKLSH